MPKKILVIDDSEIALDWVSLCLNPHGYEVLTSSSPFGTQATVIQTQPDLILLDVGMPGLSGDILCRMLKENPRTRETRVFLYSSLPESTLQELAEQSGADGYIKKTDDMDLIRRRVDKLLGRSLPSPEPGRPPIRVMVVDDSPIVLYWVQQNLSIYGYEVLTCNRPREVMGLVDLSRPELILLDVRMPWESGDQICRKLKENPTYRDIPVIFYSELPEEDLKILAKQCLADGYIVKSDDIDQLIQQISGVFDR